LLLAFQVIFLYTERSHNLNPSAWGHLNPSSYCDVGRFFYRVLNFELKCAGVYSK